MERMMKCAIYKGVKNVVVENRPIPTISDKDVLVKNLRAGICGSDVGMYLHGGENYGIFGETEFGHEMVGVIAEKGDEVSDIQIGDIVFIDPTLSTGKGPGGSVVAGAFSEYALVKDAKVNYNIFKLDKNDNLDKMVIIEPLCVGTHAAMLTEPKPEDKIVVLGAGTIGLSAASGLLARGLKNIVVVDRDDMRLEKAKQLGTMTINTSQKELKDELIQLFGAFPGYFPIPDVDLYIEASGSANLLRQCFDFAREKTRYCVVSMLPEVSLNGINFISTQPIIYGSRGYEQKDILEVIDHLQNNKTNVEIIVTKKYSINDFPKAIEAAASGKHIKVIIDFEL